MPLDSLKISHIQAVIARTYTSRTKSVVFVYQSGSSFSYTATTVIFRAQKVLDPEIPDITGSQPRQEYDTVMVVPIAVTMTGLVMVADTTTATSGSVASAEKFEPVDVLKTGIIPSGSKYVVKLRRYR